jgi:O-antigen/teichoic acid export membrane protein
MTRAQKIAKNTTVLLISQLISYMLSFFYTIYTARYLGVEGFGILSLALAITGIFGILMDIGLTQLTVREVSRNKSIANKYLNNIISIKFLLSFLTFGVIFLVINIIGYPQQTSDVVYIITLSIIIGAFTGIFNSIFQAFEKMEYQSIGVILNSVLMFTGIILIIFYKLNILAFASIYLLASILVLIYSFTIFFKSFFLPKIEFDTTFWKNIIKQALPFGFAGIFVTIYYMIDSVMLSIMVGNTAVGFYNAAYRLVFVFLSFYSVYVIAIFPVMSSFYGNAKESLKIASIRSIKYMLMISIPISIGIAMLADKIILLIYGSAYITSILALQILVWTIIFMYVNGICGNLLGAINKQPIMTKLTAMAAALNIGLNLFLIPAYSFLGASVATVITEFAILPILIYVLLKTSYIDRSVLNGLPSILVSNIIMVFVIYFLRDLNLFVIIILSAIVYFIAIYVTRALDEHDIALIKSFLNRS